MQTLLLKVEIPDELRQKDVLGDIKFGLHHIVGGGDPDCPYISALERVKIKRWYPKKSKPYVNRPGLKGD